MEIPQSMMASLDAVEKIPVGRGHSTPVLLEDIARVNLGEEVGEYHRYNQQRMVTITANVLGQDLRGATGAVRAALARLPEPPRGTTLDIRGQSAPMEQMIDSLELGLALAIVAVFLLLAAYFQSLRVAVVVVLTIPAVLSGVSLALAWTGTTLNIQSFMGAIMAIGVSLADAILLCTFAERYRREGMDSRRAAIEGVRSRMRPLLMVSITMIAGMTPLALGDAQTAPLGIAVIGGLIAATLTALFVLPSVFALVQHYSSRDSASLDPEDPDSRYFAGPGTATV